LKHCLQKKYLESTILYLLLIKQFLTKRFEQYQSFQKIFGFLFTSEALQLLDKHTYFRILISEHMHDELVVLSLSEHS
jgi:hypothetical protein